MRIGGFAAVVAIALVACHNARHGPPPSAADHVGKYQFSEHVAAPGAAGESIDLEGQVIVFADTVTVTPGPARAGST